MVYVYLILLKGAEYDAQDKYLHHRATDEEIEGHIDENRVKNCGDHSGYDRGGVEEIREGKEVNDA